MFSANFFLVLAFIILILAGLILYFEYKYKEQNHKIASMFSLISSLADELRVTKCKTFELCRPSVPAAIPKEKELLSVSEDEDEEDDDDDDDDDEDEDEDEDEEKSFTMDENIEEIEIESEQKPEILLAAAAVAEDKMPNMMFSSTTSLDTMLSSLFHGSACGQFSMVIASEFDQSLQPQPQVEELSAEDDEGESNLTPPLRSMDLTAISLPEKETEALKKQSIQKLRALVIEKNLSSPQEVGKLKKNELLKLLDPNA